MKLFLISSGRFDYMNKSPMPMLLALAITVAWNLALPDPNETHLAIVWKYRLPTTTMFAMPLAATSIDKPFTAHPPFLTKVIILASHL
jgi:H+/gluconate symporter-like permease